MIDFRRDQIYRVRVRFIARDVDGTRIFQELQAIHLVPTTVSMNHNRLIY